jgi:hypothetical protein
MGQWREIAARANASLLRDRRMEPGIQHGDKQLREVRTRAGITLRDHICAKEHHCPHL